MTTMPPSKALGRLQQVDLRTAWISEAGGFTPWLAQEENLCLLGKTIGIDLELEAQERNVGPFRADILCKDTTSNNWVLIENQLDRTDHTHLGQLLTYAAGLDADTIVCQDDWPRQHEWLRVHLEKLHHVFGPRIRALPSLATLNTP